MKIAFKITLSFLTVFVLITIIVSAISFFIAKNNLEKEIGAHLETAIDSRAQHIQTYLSMLKISVGQLSKSVVLENFLKINTGDSLKNEAFEVAMLRLKRTKEANPSVYEFLLLDTTGKVIASTDKNSIGQDKSNDAFFVGGQKETYIKDAYFSEALKKPLMAVSCPVLNSQTQKLIGVLVARFELSDLDKITTNTIGMGNTGEIYIVNKYGYMITPSRFSKDTFLKQKVDTLNIKNAQLHKISGPNHKGEKGVAIYRDYRGEMVLGTHVYLPEMQWAILGEVNLGEAYAPLASIRIFFFAVLFFVPIIMWLVGMSLSRTITEPIHKLHKGTEIIGSGNLEYKVGTNAKDEIGQLSRAFDLMTEDLKKSRDEFQSLANNLEDKVRERTEELTNGQEATLNILEDLNETKNNLDIYVKKLQEALRIKSDFTSTVSHELRTPMAAIKESINIVFDGSAGVINDEQREFLGIAKRNVDRLSKLINDVLDFQKLESGRMDFAIQENSINEAIKEAEETMHSIVAGKGLGFNIKIDENLPKVKFDKDKIIQVLINLINNAVKFTAKGSISLSASQGNNVIKVSVQDTGPGIKAEDMEKLFQKFSQLEAISERKPGSSGLGLAICKEIIEKHFGKIWAESKPGEGSTFSFVLPVVERRR